MLTVIKSFKNTEPMSQNINTNVKDDTIYVYSTNNTIYVPEREKEICINGIASASDILKLAKKVSVA